MTPGAAVDWLDDLIAVPTLVEQLAFIEARPGMFPPDGDVIAPAVTAEWLGSQRRMNAIAGAFGGAAGALGGVFGAAAAMQSEMAAFHQAEMTHRLALASHQMELANDTRRTRLDANRRMNDRGICCPYCGVESGRGHAADCSLPALELLK